MTRHFTLIVTVFPTVNENEELVETGWLSQSDLVVRELNSLKASRDNVMPTLEVVPFPCSPRSFDPGSSGRAVIVEKVQVQCSKVALTFQ